MRTLKYISSITMLALLVLVFVQCKKDPVKGWSFFKEPPPPPEIVAVSSVIKNCEPPYPVTFYQECANLIGDVNYFWDFGDGNTSTSPNPTHIYQTPGNYKIKFMISNKIGFDSTSFYNSELNLSSIPVEANFQYSRTNNNSYAPNQLIFYNYSSGANVFDWDFGYPNAVDNDDEPTHVFHSPGTYTIKLKGTCTNGTFDEYTQQIQVLNAPTRVFIDSLNLMLPSRLKNTDIFIDIWHGMQYLGSTSVRSGSFPMKFYKSTHYPSNLFFDGVQFTNNEIFKFIISKDNGPEPPTLEYEILLSSIDIQNNFYPDHYYDIRTVPYINDVFIDLYLSY